MPSLRSLLLLLMLSCIAVLNAADRTWDGGGDGVSFTDAANWDADTLPVANNSLEFPLGSGGSLYIDLGGSSTVALDDISVTGTGDITFFSSGGNFTLRNDQDVTIDVPSGAIANFNVSFIKDSSNDLIMDNSSGGGEIILNHGNVGLNCLVEIQDMEVTITNATALGATGAGQETFLNHANAVLVFEAINGTVAEQVNVGNASANIYANVNGGETTELSAVHTGNVAATFTKFNGGILELSGSSTWDLNFEVADGALHLSDTSDAGDGTVTVHAGGLLLVSGSAGVANVSVLNAGTVEIGTSSDLTVGTFTLAPAGIVELFVDDDGDETDDDNAQIITTDLTLDGVLLVQAGTFDLVNNYALFTYSNSLTDNDMSISFPTATANRFEIDTVPNPDEVQLVVGNRAPSTSINTVALNEDGIFVFTEGMFNYSDPDGDAFAGINVTIAVANGELFNDGDGDNINSGEDVGTGFVSIADINAGQLKFLPDPDAHGSGYGNFTFNVSDGTDTSSAVLMTVNVNSINDVPTSANGTVTGANNATFNFAISDFNRGDVETPAANLIIEIEALETNGDLDYNGSDANIGDRVDFNGGDTLDFTPSGTDSGSPYASFQFSVYDGADNSATYTMIVNISPPGNSAPTLSATTLNAVEDTDLIISAGMLGYADADGDALNNLEIVADAGLGTLYIDLNDNGEVNGASEELVNTETISKAQVDAGRFKFKPAQDANGNNYTTFQILANDGSTDGGASTFTIDVAAVNDVPFATNSTVATPVSTSLTFDLSDFGFSDPADSGDTLQSITILSLPTNGIIEDSGATEYVSGDLPITLNGTDIDTNNDLVFVPNPGSTGTPYGTFTFTVNDGTTDSLNTAVMSVNVSGNFVSWDDGSNNDDWDHDSGKNWDPDGIPGVDSDMIIDEVAVDQHIKMNVNSNPIASLQLTGTGEIEIREDVAGSTLVFSSTSTLNIPAGLTFDVQCPIDIVSDGTLTVTGGGTLLLSDDMGAAITNDTIIIGPGVTLAGECTLGNVVLQNGAILQPGGSGDGQIIVNNLTCSTTSIIEMELDNDATDNTDDDRIVANGTVVMNGFLDIQGGSLDLSNLYTLFSGLTTPATGSFTLQMPGADPGAIQTTASTILLGVGNQAPSVTGATVPTNEDTDVQITTSHLGYSDPEPDPLDFITVTSITATGTFYLDNNSSLTFDGGDATVGAGVIQDTVIAANRLRYEPALNDTSSATLDFTATDDQGATSTSGTITVTINPQNDPPSFVSSPVLTATDNTLYTYTIQVTDPETADGSLVVTAPTQPAWIVNLINIGSGNWTFSGTPLTPDIGNHPVILQVSDGSLTDTQNFVITVTDGNAVPNLPAFGTYLSAIRNQPLTLDYNTILSHTMATDADGDTLNFRIITLGTGTLVSLPSLVPVNVGDSINPGEIWQWTPPVNVELSTETAFSIQANDGALDNGITRDFDIYVDTVDLPPEQVFLGTNNTGIIQFNSLAQQNIAATDLYYYDPEDTGGPDFHFNGQPGWVNPYPGKTTQPVNEANVVYTITSHLDVNVGGLFLGGSPTPLGLNDTFTQEDIMNGDLVYKHSGGQFDGNAGDDQYIFTIDDSNGNQITGVTLNLDIVFSTLAPVVDLFAQSVGGTNPGAFFFTEDNPITSTHPTGFNDSIQLFTQPYVTAGDFYYDGGEMVISIIGGAADAGDNLYIVDGAGWWFGGNTITVGTGSVPNRIIYNNTTIPPIFNVNQIGFIDTVENGLAGQALRISWTGQGAFIMPSREIIRDLLSRVAYRYIGDNPPAGTRQIQVAISDSNGVFGFGTRDLVINSINDPPTAIPGPLTFTTIDGASVRAVFALSDPDNPVGDLVLREVTGQEHNPLTGDLDINDPFAGAIDYEHFNGNPGDSFQLEVFDGAAASSATTVNINVVTIDADGPTLESDAPMEVEEGVNFFYAPVVDDLWETNNGGAGSGYNFALAGQVPVGLTINGSNQLQWINPDPQAIKNASFGIIITHIDSGKIGYQPVIITVKEDLSGGG